MISGFRLPSVQAAPTPDYDVFKIANASGNLDKCTTIGMYFYVGNGSRILIYDLQTKTLFYSWNLGGGYSTTQIIKRSETWIYWKGLNSGVTELKCFRVGSDGNLTLLDTVVPTSPSWTNWNSDLRNAAYILNSSLKYWAWTDMAVTYTAKYEWSETVTIYNTAGTGQRFYSCGKIVDWYSVGYATTGRIRTYVLNVTASTISMVETTYSYWVQNDFWGYQKVSVACVKEAGAIVAPDSAWAGDYNRYYVNIQNWVNSSANYYFSWLQYAVRDKTIISATLPAVSGAAKYVYIDLPDKIYHISGLDIDGCRIQPATSAGGGAWTTVNLSNNTNIASQSEGVMAVGRWQDETATSADWVGFISSTNNRPTANKISGGSAILVGQLPVATYTPTGARVYNGATNIVAAFTLAANTSLLVCRNLIPMSVLTMDYGPFAYLTYYYTAGGVLYAGWAATTNGSTLTYVDGRTVVLAGLAASNKTYLSINWTGSQTTDNPYTFTIDGNDTIWAYFGSAGGSGPPASPMDPVARWNSTLLVYVNQSYCLNGSISTDPDGSITGWSWDFDDGNVTAGSSIVYHTWTGLGTYNSSLTVTDDSNATDIFYFGVQSIPSPPVLSGNATESKVLLGYTFYNNDSATIRIGSYVPPAGAATNLLPFTMIIGSSFIIIAIFVMLIKRR